MYEDVFETLAATKLDVGNKYHAVEFLLNFSNKLHLHPLNEVDRYLETRTNCTAAKGKGKYAQVGQ